MSKTTMRLLGIAGGFLLIFLSTAQFMRSYQEGNTKWYNLVMISGMGLILYYTLFRKSNKPKKDNQA